MSSRTYMRRAGAVHCIASVRNIIRFQGYDVREVEL